MASTGHVEPVAGSAVSLSTLTAGTTRANIVRVGGASADGRDTRARAWGAGAGSSGDPHLPGSVRNLREPSLHVAPTHSIANLGSSGGGAVSAKHASDDHGTRQSAVAEARTVTPTTASVSMRHGEKRSWISASASSDGVVHSPAQLREQAKTGRLPSNSRVPATVTAGLQCSLARCHRSACNGWWALSAVVLLAGVVMGVVVFDMRRTTLELQVVDELNAGGRARTAMMSQAMTKHANILDAIALHVSTTNTSDLSATDIIPMLDVVVTMGNSAGEGTMSSRMAFVHIVSEEHREQYEVQVGEASGLPMMIWAPKVEGQSVFSGIIRSENRGFYAPVTMFRPPGSSFDFMRGLDLFNTAGQDDPVDTTTARNLLTVAMSAFRYGAPLLTRALDVADASGEIDTYHVLLQAVYALPGDEQSRMDARSYSTYNPNLYARPTDADDRVDRVFGFVLSLLNLEDFITRQLAGLPDGMAAVVEDATDSEYVHEALSRAVSSGGAILVAGEQELSDVLGTAPSTFDVGFAIAPDHGEQSGAEQPSTPSSAQVFTSVPKSMLDTVPCGSMPGVAAVIGGEAAAEADACAMLATSEPSVLQQQLVVFGSRVFLVRYGAQKSVIDSRMPQSIWSIDAPDMAAMLVNSGALLLAAICAIVARLWDVRASQQLETHKREKAEAAKAAHAAVLAYVSHEARNPLHQIAASADFLNDAVPEGSPLRADVDAIRSAVSNAQMLVDDVLDHAKLESGNLTIQPSVVSLRAVVNSMMLQHQGKAGSVNLSGIVDERVPRRVMVDELRVRQLLANGISNSLRHCLEGSVDVHVGIATSSDEAVAHAGSGADALTLVITIADTGSGLGGVDAESLFQPFAQGNGSGATSTRRRGAGGGAAGEGSDTSPSPHTDLGTRGKLGTGLGLAICRLLARAMGGDCGLYDRLEGPPITLRGLVGSSVPSLESESAIASGAHSSDVAAAHTAAIPMPITAETNETKEAPSLGHGRTAAGYATAPPNDDDDVHGAVFWVLLPVMPVASARATEDVRAGPRPSWTDAERASRGGNFRPSPDRLSSVDPAAQSPVRGHTPHAARLQASGTGTFNDDRLVGRHVVCVDDDAINRRLLVRMLQSLGATAVALTDGDELIPHLREHHPTLFDASPSQHGDSSRAGRRVTPVAVLLDIMMARVGGIEACGLLREAGVELPCIATTGNASGHDRDAYLRSGFQDVVSKPFDKHQLARVLGKHIGGSDHRVSPAPKFADK